MNMKKIRLPLLALFIVATFNSLSAQTSDGSFAWGAAQDFLKNLTDNNVSRKALNLQLSATRSIDVKITDDQSSGQQINIYGEVLGVTTSIFYMYGSPQDIKGKIVIDNKEGFELSTDASTKQMMIRSVDVNKLICVMDNAKANPVKKNEGSSGSIHTRTSTQPAYSSFPDAPFVLFLNFDGEYVNDSYWNSQMGGAKNCTG